MCLGNELLRERNMDEGWAWKVYVVEKRKALCSPFQQIRAVRGRWTRARTQDCLRLSWKRSWTSCGFYAFKHKEDAEQAARLWSHEESATSLPFTCVAKRVHYRGILAEGVYSYHNSWGDREYRAEALRVMEVLIPRTRRKR